MLFSAESILKGAKARTLLPTNQFQLEDSEYLELIDDDLQTVIVPLLMSLRQNYFLTHKDYTIKTDESVAGFGDDEFGLFPFGSPIPVSTQDLLERTVGLVVKDIWYMDTNNKVLGECPQITFGDIKNYNNFAQGWYFENSKIVFHPIQNFNNQNIRIFSFRKPGTLIDSSKAASIVFSNPTTMEIQVDVVPDGWGIGTKLDIIRGKQGFDSVVDNIMIVSPIVANRFQVTQLPSNLNNGDIVTPAGYAPVAQIPLNAIPLLKQRGAIKILETTKDTKGLAVAMKLYDDLEKKFKGANSNRAQSNLPKMIGYGIWR